MQVAVTGLAGQPLLRQVLEARSFRHRLDLRTLAPGTYLLRVQTPAQTFTRRLVIGR